MLFIKIQHQTEEVKIEKSAINLDSSATSCDTNSLEYYAEVGDQKVEYEEIEYEQVEKVSTMNFRKINQTKLTLLTLFSEKPTRKQQNRK